MLLSNKIGGHVIYVSIVGFLLPAPPRIINSGACTPEYLCIAAGDVDHTRVYTRVHPEYMPWYIQITYPGIYRVHTYVPWYERIQYRGINWSIAGF